jgi:hypothetical protein
MLILNLNVYRVEPFLWFVFHFVSLLLQHVWFWNGISSKQHHCLVRYCVLINTVIFLDSFCSSSFKLKSPNLWSSLLCDFICFLLVQVLSSISKLPLRWETRFYTCVKQQVKLYLYIFWFLGFWKEAHIKYRSTYQILTMEIFNNLTTNSIFCVTAEGGDSRCLKGELSKRTSMQFHVGHSFFGTWCENMYILPSPLAS